MPGTAEPLTVVHRRYRRPVRGRAALAHVVLLAITASGQLGAQALSLQEAVQRAADASRQIRLAELQAETARLGVREAEAARMPVVGAQASASVLTNPPEGITLPAGILGTQQNPGDTFPTPLPPTPTVLVPDPAATQYQVVSTLDQPIFSWGKLLQGIAAAEAEEQIAIVALDQARIRLAADTATAYFGLAAARQSAELTERIAELAEQNLADRRAEFAEGLVTREEILAAESQTAQARSGNRLAQQALSTAETAFALLVPGGATELATAALAPRDDALDQTVLEPALRANSPDLAQRGQEARLAEIGREVELASGPWNVDLGLNLRLELSGERVPLVQLDWRESWDANLIITLAGQVTLYDPARQARLEAAEAQLLLAREGLEAQAEALELELRQAMEGVESARARLAQNEASLALQREQLRAARIASENQLITRSAVRGAEILLLQSRLSVIEARFQLGQALISLARLTGQPLASLAQELPAEIEEPGEPAE